MSGAELRREWGRQRNFGSLSKEEREDGVKYLEHGARLGIQTGHTADYIDAAGTSGIATESIC